jgi:hypothetical protein
MLSSEVVKKLSEKYASQMTEMDDIDSSSPLLNLDLRSRRPEDDPLYGNWKVSEILGLLRKEPLSIEACLLWLREREAVAENGRLNTYYTPEQLKAISERFEGV